MSQTSAEDAYASLRQTTRAMTTNERSRLLLSLIRSDACIAIFAQLMAQDQTDGMRALKNFVTHNPTGFDPNPWENIREPVTVTNTARPGKTITSLPNELLLQIGTFLPPTSRVALVLTNRNLYQRLAPSWIPQRRVNALTFDQKWELLQLLEDEESNNRVACPQCFKLHHWNSAYCLDIRTIAPSGPEPFIPRFRVRIPKFFNYNVVRMMGLAYSKHGPDSAECRRLLQLGAKTQSMWSPSCRAARSLTNKFVDGKLISRSQIAIAPCINNKFTGSSFLELIQIITQPDFQICDHFHWPQFIKYLDGLADSNTSGEDDNWPHDTGLSQSDKWGKSGRAQESNYRFYQIWDRERETGVVSRRENEIPHHLHPTILSPALHRLFYWGFRGHVRSCKSCATDFGLGIQYVWGVGPALVMSVWRDLGGPCQGTCESLEYSDVRCPKKWRWDTHRCDPRRYTTVIDPVSREFASQGTEFSVMRQITDLRSAGGLSRGSIYKAFESVVRGVSRDTLSATDFTPQLEEGDTMALQHAQPSASRQTFLNPETRVVEEEPEPATTGDGLDIDLGELRDHNGDVIMGGTDAFWNLQRTARNEARLCSAFQNLSLND
ncbi:hypothetical protein V8F20_008311 [Naviculisporaceae sp. PSN 640]